MFVIVTMVVIIHTVSQKRPHIIDRNLKTN